MQPSLVSRCPSHQSALAPLTSRLGNATATFDSDGLASLGSCRILSGAPFRSLSSTSSSKWVAVLSRAERGSDKQQFQPAQPFRAAATDLTDDGKVTNKATALAATAELAKPAVNGNSIAKAENGALKVPITPSQDVPAPVATAAHANSNGAASAAAAPSLPQKVSTKDMRRQSKPFEIRMRVRDYELDQYQVVNHAVYCNYCHEARAAFFAHYGFSADEFASRGEALATSELQMKYMTPLRSGDEFVVATSIVASSPIRITLEHIIYRVSDKKQVLEGKATCVFLDRTYRPCRMPKDVSQKLNALLNNELVIPQTVSEI